MSEADKNKVKELESKIADLEKGKPEPKPEKKKKKK